TWIPHNSRVVEKSPVQKTSRSRRRKVLSKRKQFRRASRPERRRPRMMKRRSCLLKTKSRERSTGCTSTAGKWVYKSNHSPRKAAIRQPRPRDGAGIVDAGPLSQRGSSFCSCPPSGEKAARYSLGGAVLFSSRLRT